MEECEQTLMTDLGQKGLWARGDGGGVEWFLWGSPENPCLLQGAWPGDISCPVAPHWFSLSSSASIVIKDV